MFVFKEKQKTFDIGGVKIGGQLGELPTVLIGSIFYQGQKIVEDQKRGTFDREKAKELIRRAEGLSEITGNPQIIDVVISYPDAIKNYIDFFSEVTDAPFLIDGVSADVITKALDEWKIMRDYNNGIRSDKIRNLHGITEDMLLRLSRVYRVKPYALDNLIKPKTEPVILTGKISGKSIRIFNKTLWDFIQKNGQYYMHFYGASGGGDATTIDVRIDKDSTGSKLNAIKTKGGYGAYVWIARFKHKIRALSGKIIMNVYTDDEALKHVLMEINGSLRLDVPQVFLRGSIRRRYKNTALVQVCCRELASALKRENVSTVYVDVRDGYCIIKPTKHQPSVNTHVSYLQNDGDHIRFSIPRPHSKIQYVGILGIDLNTKNLFITDGEHEISKELLSNGYILKCGSYHHAFDIEVLKFNGGIERRAVIQIKDCKPIRNARDFVIADVYSCELFSKTTNHTSFLVLNREWRNVLSDFDGFDVYNNARKNGVHFFFVDYSCAGWSKKVVDAITRLLPPQNFPTSIESCSVQASS